MTSLAANPTPRLFLSYAHDDAAHRRLAQADPDNVEPAEARRLWQAARDIARRLAEIDPGNATYARDLRYYETRLAEAGPSGDQ